MAVLVNAPPCVLHEDEHLLVVNKPAGLNTHAPAPFAGEGIFDWLRSREPRWADLGIIHRLDKTTSGVMVFPKTKLANRTLGDQFAKRKVRKEYLFLSATAPKEKMLTVRCQIAREGDKYAASRTGDFAETRFTWLREEKGYQLWRAEPLTGRTHQIRVHAQLKGLPILGDTLYGGEPFPRVCLHAEQLSAGHPQTGAPVTWQAAADFFGNPAAALRAALIDPAATNAFRMIHGAADGHPGFYLDCWSDWLLASSASGLAEPERKLVARYASRGIYHKMLDRHVRQSSMETAAPVLISGSAAPEPFEIVENGMRFEISFARGYSTGLFLDQRENRRRLLVNWAGAKFPLFEKAPAEVLNTFAYTCAFSVCAAIAGAKTTSIDLSRKYLEWGKRNFVLNGVAPEQHDFIYGDVFDWAARFAKANRKFDLILLDPPTFSQVKGGPAFQAERDYGRLVRAVLPLLRSEGVLFASSNAHKLAPDKFVQTVQGAIQQSGRGIGQSLYIPQPPDFPASREERPYLKTLWIRVK